MRRPRNRRASKPESPKRRMVEMTLKDCQRHLAKKGSPIAHEHSFRGDEWIVIWQDNNTCPKCNSGWPLACPRCIDRMINEFGSDASVQSKSMPNPREVGQERKKETDEVAAVSDNPGDGEKHGGDGNSGEVDHKAETSAKESRDNNQSSNMNSGQGESASPELPESTNQNGSGTGRTEGVTTDDTQNPTGTTEDNPEPEDGQVNNPANPQKDPDNVASRQDGDAHQSDNAQPVSADDDLPYRDATADGVRPITEEDAGQTTEHTPNSEQELISKLASMGIYESREPRLSYGGNFLPPKPARGSSAKNRRDAVKALKRFVEKEVGGYGDTPTWDGAKLVRELTTKRYSLNRCRRKDTQRKRILIAVDVSGSCSATCGEAYMAAKELTAVNDRIVLYIHSNGWPEEFVIDGKIIKTPTLREFRQAEDEITSEVMARLNSLNITTAIIMGDCDAAWLYQGLSDAKVKLVWLDSYCASYGDARLEKKAPIEGVKCEYWTRCNTVNDFLRVLKHE